MPLKEINILRRHGKQFVPDLRKAILPEIFRGRPVISGNITLDEAQLACNLCPVGAIEVNSAAPDLKPADCSIDLGKCV